MPQQRIFTCTRKGAASAVFVEHNHRAFSFQLAGNGNHQKSPDGITGSQWTYSAYENPV